MSLDVPSHEHLTVLLPHTGGQGRGFHASQAPTEADAESVRGGGVPGVVVSARRRVVSLFLDCSMAAIWYDLANAIGENLWPAPCNMR